MEKRKLGNSGVAVAPVCFGGNVFGWTIDEQQSHALLDAFVAAGFNFIDTADSYSRWVPGNKGGESESIIGTWMKQRGNRDQVIELLTNRLSTATAVDWETLLRPLGLPVRAVVGLDVALETDDVARRQMVKTIDTADGPLRLIGNPIHVGADGGYAPPPRLHEHNEEILGEL